MARAAAPASSPVLLSFGSRDVVRRDVYWKLRVLTHRSVEDCPLFAHIDRPKAPEGLLVSHQIRVRKFQDLDFGLEISEI